MTGPYVWQTQENLNYLDPVKQSYRSCNSTSATKFDKHLHCVTKAVAPEPYPWPSLQASLQKTTTNHILQLCSQRRNKSLTKGKLVRAGSAPDAGQRLPSSSWSPHCNSKISAHLHHDGSTTSDPDARRHPPSSRGPPFQEEPHLFSEN